MREYEKRFYDLVEIELKPLRDIQEKLGMNYEDAEKLADYLTKERIIRSTKMSSNLTPWGYIYLVALPIEIAMLNDFSKTPSNKLSAKPVEITPVPHSIHNHFHLEGDGNQVIHSSGNNMSNIAFIDKVGKKPTKTLPSMAIAKWILYVFGGIVASVIAGYILYKIIGH